MAAIQVMSQQVMTQQLNDWQSDHREKHQTEFAAMRKVWLKNEYSEKSIPFH